ncbi:expressed unknown protein [Seminavis robusta]|uniref:Uncharacterized protein n=1 Tax=Seminavis robusta TaxID=568900 RepID=A0A9N8HKW6_9STRA|nr:expressed unknown protein [Seminavis robusta]|eukprot:Sro782_g201750.1 n/a (335) ;mRNA; f:26854-27858
MSKRPAESDPPLSEKSYKKRPSVTMDMTSYSVLEVVMKQPGLLHWTDLLKIGATCKEMSSLTKPLLDSSLAPLLEYLEGMCRSNVHFDCAKFYAPRSMRKCQCDASNCHHDSELPQNQTLDSLDPRNKNDYESWIACKKCCAMTEFLAAVIATMQAHFDFSDPSNPKQWRSEGLLDGPQSSIFSMKHNRASLVINLAVLSIFNHAIKCGDTCTGSHYFNNDLLGNDPIDGSGSCGSLTPRETLDEMLPLRNQDFVRFIRDDLYPTPDEMALLGPIVPKVVLATPLFCWVSPNPDGAIMLQSLPSKLEPINDTEIRDRFGLEDDLERANKRLADS